VSKLAKDFQHVKEEVQSLRGRDHIADEHDAALEARSREQLLQNALTPPETAQNDGPAITNLSVKATLQHGGEPLQATSNSSSIPNHSLTSDGSSTSGGPSTSDHPSTPGSSTNTESHIPRPRATPQDSSETGHRAGQAASEREFALPVEEMGENFVPNIMQFVSDDMFTGKISVKNLPPINWANLQPPPKDHLHLGVTYSSAQVMGVTHLRLSEPAKFKFPDFSQAIEKPS